MPQAPQAAIRLRLIVENPVPGVMHSLQDRNGDPVDAKRSAAGEPISFEFPIRVSAGPKFYGEQVRNGGGDRRFVYVAVGKQAGDAGSFWDRRMKIDIHTIPQSLLDAAARADGLEGILGGTGADGTPACATVRTRSWRAIRG